MVGTKDCEPRALRMSVEFAARMQLRISAGSVVDEPQPILEVTLYHMAALADEFRAGMSDVVPDSWMKALAIGSLRYV